MSRSIGFKRSKSAIKHAPMKRKNIQILYPGDKTSTPVPNTLGILENKAYVFGILAYTGSRYFLDSNTGRYSPSIGDLVLGRVFYRSAEYYKLDLKHLVGVLPSLAFRNATKRFKPELDVNEYVLAKITKLGSECLLSCVEEGLGKLQGYVLDIEAWKAEKLSTGTFLKEVGERYAFKCAIGLNGRIWIEGEDIITTKDVANHMKSFN